MEQVDYRKQCNEILSTLAKIEYVGNYKIIFSLFPDEWTEPTKELIDDGKGGKAFRKETFKGFRTTWRSNGKVIYTRTIVGESEEHRFALATSMFDDVLNAGVQLIHRLYLEEKELERVLQTGLIEQARNRFGTQASDASKVTISTQPNKKKFLKKK